MLAEGVELFNSGEYWHSHEVWEREWTLDRKGPDSGFYKGLIQVAAGCLHYTRHNRRGGDREVWGRGAGDSAAVGKRLAVAAPADSEGISAAGLD